MKTILKAYYFLIGFFLFIVLPINAQDQKEVDSLLTLYNSNELVGVERLEILNLLAFNETSDLDASLQYSNELIELASQSNNHLYVSYGYISKGNTHRLSGDFDLALEAFFKSNAAAKKAKDLESEAVSLTTIADVYSEIGNSENAELYYKKGIAILRKTKDEISLASALLNAGDEYYNNGKYSLALKNFKESGLIFKRLDYLVGSAYTLGNIGMVYAKQGNPKAAKINIDKAISILEEKEVYSAISEYLTIMSDIYLEQNDIANALSYANQSLEMAEKFGLKQQISDSNLKLSDIHKQIDSFSAALSHFETHIKYRDELINLENVSKIADLRTDHEVSQKQVEVDLLNQQKRNQLIILGFTSLLLFTLFWYYRTIRKEKRKSENLLLNILPEDTAHELKKYGKVKAKKFDSISVLFTDFKGFTKYAEHLPPEKLVESVDYYFSKFDAIIENHGLEKIKTIGDAYMCAGGLNDPNNNHAKKIVLAAMEIAEFVKESRENNTNNDIRFEIRIGINTGPVVAGVVGTKKFSYDIWGDSVNIASRMESNSESGKINISHDTYNLIKNDFDCEFRGEIAIKNRGQMKMYFVNKNENSSIKKEQNTQLVNSN